MNSPNVIPAEVQALIVDDPEYVLLLVDKEHCNAPRRRAGSQNLLCPSGLTSERCGEVILEGVTRVLCGSHTRDNPAFLLGDGWYRVKASLSTSGDAPAVSDFLVQAMSSSSAAYLLNSALELSEEVKAALRRVQGGTGSPAGSGDGSGAGFDAGPLQLQAVQAAMNQQMQVVSKVGDPHHAEARGGVPAGLQDVLMGGGNGGGGGNMRQSQHDEFRANLAKSMQVMGGGADAIVGKGSAIPIPLDGTAGNTWQELATKKFPTVLALSRLTQTAHETRGESLVVPPQTPTMQQIGLLTEALKSLVNEQSEILSRWAQMSGVGSANAAYEERQQRKRDGSSLLAAQEWRLITLATSSPFETGIVQALEYQ